MGCLLALVGLLILTGSIVVPSDVVWLGWLLLMVGVFYPSDSKD